MPRLSHEPQNAPEYYEYMGRAVCIWGRFETNFTTDLFFMAGTPGLEGLFKKFPQSWGQKLDAFLKCFSKLPDLGTHKEAAEKFVEEAKSVAKNRNIIAHGSFWAFVIEEPLTAEFTMANVDPKNGSLLSKRYSCTIEEMKKIVIDVDNLNTLYVSISFRVGEILNDIKMNGRPSSPSPARS